MGSTGAMGHCTTTTPLRPLWDLLQPLRALGYRDLKGVTSSTKWLHPNFPPPSQELRQSLTTTTRGRHFLINNNNTSTTHSTTLTLHHIYTAIQTVQKVVP